MGNGQQELGTLFNFIHVLNVIHHCIPRLGICVMKIKEGA